MVEVKVNLEGERGGWMQEIRLEMTLEFKTFCEMDMGKDF